MSSPPAPSAPAPRPSGFGGWVDRTLASFRTVNYRWFFFGQGTSVVGMWMRNAAQGWLVYEMTGSKVLLGAVAAVAQASMGVVAPWGGTLSDRFDKRRLLIGLGLFSGAVSLALGALILTDTITVPLLVVLAAVAGGIKGVEIPARQSFIVEMVGREHLTNAIALNTATFNSARVIGPVLAGLVIDRLAEGIAVCFLLDGFSYGAIVLAMARIKPIPLEKRAARGRWIDQVREGMGYVRGHLRVRTLLTLLGIFVGCGWSFLAIMPAFARDVLGMGGLGYGVLMADNGFGALLGAVWVASVGLPGTRRRLRRELLAAILLGCGATTVFAFSTDFRVCALALVFAGFGAIAFLSRANSLVQMAVPDDLRGRVMSLWVLTFIGSMAVGGLAVGALAERFGSPHAIVAMQAACALLSTVVFLRLPPATDAPVHAPPTEADPTAV